MIFEKKGSAAHRKIKRLLSPFGRCPCQGGGHFYCPKLGSRTPHRTPLCFVSALHINRLVEAVWDKDGGHVVRVAQIRQMTPQIAAGSIAESQFLNELRVIF